MATDETLEQRIAAWRQDDRRPFDAAFRLLCSAEAELTALRAQVAQLQQERDKLQAFKLQAFHDDYLKVAESRRRIEEIVLARRTRDEALAALAQCQQELRTASQTIVQEQAQRMTVEQERDRLRAALKALVEKADALVENSDVLPPRIWIQFTREIESGRELLAEPPQEPTA